MAAPRFPGNDSELQQRHRENLARKQAEPRDYHAEAILQEQVKRVQDPATGTQAGAWSSTLQEELGYIVSDLTAAGFKPSDIRKTLEQQCRMLDKLHIPYQRIKF